MNSFNASVSPHPFYPHSRPITGLVGQTVDAIARIAGVTGSYVAYINGHRLSPSLVKKIRPKAGTKLVIHATAQGGNGNKSLGIILQVLVAVASVVTFQYYLNALQGPAFGLSAGLSGAIAAGAAAGVSLVGGLLIRALIPPQSISIPDGVQSRSDSVQSITGTRNQANPYGTIPQVLGKHRMFPPYAAPPFTEIVGDDQFLRLLFTFGYGPLDISDIRIGDTPISEFEDVEYEWREGSDSDEAITLYPSGVSQENLSISLPQPSGLTKNNGDPTTRIVDSGRTPQTIYATGVITVNSDDPIYDEDDVEIPDDDFTDLSVGDTIILWANWKNQLRGSYRILEKASNTQITVDPSVDGMYHGGPGSWGYNRDSWNGRGEVYKMDADWGWQQRRTGPDITEISVDITWPGGIYALRFPEGVSNRVPFWGFIEIEMREVGETEWVYVGTINEQANSTSTVRRSYRWTVDEGQYDVRVRCAVWDQEVDTVVNAAAWTALRGYRGADPINEPNMTKLAVRIRATDQLNGIVDSLSAVVQTKAKAWNGASWVEGPTSNPAALVRHVLQGTANPEPLEDGRLNLTALQTWSEDCDANGWEFNSVSENPTTIYDTLRDICSVGLASFSMVDGKYSVFQDKAQTTPRALISPRNSIKFSGTKTFQQPVHALKVQFTDRRTWERSQKIVFDDGFNESNASRYEELATIGITDPNQAHTFGRYNLAVNRLRDVLYEVVMDFENLVVTRGDLVLLSHDIPLIGVSSHRITGVNHSGSDLVSVDIEGFVAMEDSVSYSSRVRDSANTITTAPLVTTVGDQTTLEFSTPLAEDSVAVGDLIVVGVAGEEILECIVRGIEPRNDFEAKLTLVPAAPEIHSSTVNIPDFDSGGQTGGGVSNSISPPTIQEVTSDTALRVTFGPMQSQPNFIPISYQGQIRTNGSATWIAGPIIPVSSATMVFTDVVAGQDYDIRVRLLGAEDKVSPWVTVFAHTVVGDTIAPSAPTDLRLEEGILRWSLLNLPSDFSGFRIRVHTGSNWDDAVSLTPTPLAASELNVSAYTSSGTKTFMVRSEDLSGNQSVETTLTRTFVAQDRGIVFSQDHGAESFADGTITNATTSSDTLIADETGLDRIDFWLYDDAEELDLPSPAFWSETDTDNFWSSGTFYKRMVFETTFNPDLLDDSGPYRVRTEPDLTGRLPKVEYKVGTDWSPWPGALDNQFDPISIDFRITIEESDVQGVINEFTIYVDSTLHEEELNDVEIEVGGTRLPITYPFTTIIMVGDLHVEDAGISTSSFPLGMMVAAAAITSSDFLEANGQAVSRTTYADLWSWANSNSLVDDMNPSAYGTGNGSTTFTLPNFGGRTLVGLNSSDSDFNAVFETGGEKTHLLTGAESGVPIHTHTITDLGHNHTIIDSGHTHSVTDPGHAHSVTDPGHTHGTTDGGHTHVINDTNHDHGGSTGVGSAHSHTINNGTLVIRTAEAGAIGVAAGTDYEFDEFSLTTASESAHTHTISSGTTGATTASATGGGDVDSEVTGVSVDNDPTGISIVSGTTSITLGDSMAADTGSLTAYGTYTPGLNGSIGWKGSDASAPPSTFGMTSETELSGAELSNLATDDATVLEVTGTNPGVRIRFRVNEEVTATTITAKGVEASGGSSGGDDRVELSIWNFDTEAYELLDSVGFGGATEDNFNRSDENLEVSSNWSKQDSGDLPGTLAISSNSLATGDTTSALYRWASDVAGDHYAQADITGTNSGGPAVRLPALGNAGGYACHFSTGFGVAAIFRIESNGTTTVLAEGGMGDLSTGIDIKLTATGSSLTLHRGATLLVSTSDATWDDSNVGVGVYCLENRSPNIDNWEATAGASGVESTDLSGSISSDLEDYVSEGYAHILVQSDRTGSVTLGVSYIAMAVTGDVPEGGEGGFSIGNASLASASSAHNNLQPYTTVKWAIKAVSPGGGSKWAEIQDLDASGPLLVIKDNYGNDVGGVVSCTVKGY